MDSASPLQEVKMTSGVWHMSLVCRWDLSTDGKFGLHGKTLKRVLCNVTCVPESFALFPYRAHCTAVLFHLGSLPHSHITSLAYRLLFTVETHFLLCFNNSVLQPQHNITTAFIGIFIYHSHHAYHLAPCWSSNDRPYYSSLSHHTLPPSFPTSKAAVSSVIRSSGVFHHPTEKSTSAASLVQIILGRSTAGMGRSTTMGQGSGLHTPEAVLVLFLK